METTAFDGKAYAGNPHVQFNVENVTSPKPWRSFPLYKVNKSLFCVTAFSAYLSVCGADNHMLKGESFSVSNDVPVALTDAIHVQYGSLGIAKNGLGTYTLPRGLVDARDPFALAVGAGRVNVTADGAPTAEIEPTELLNLASFWLDASKNVVRDSDGKVVNWYDVRETQNADGTWGTTRPCAQAITEPKNGSGVVYTPDAPRVQTPEGMTLPMVYFGGLTTGTGANFRKADRSGVQPYTAIRDIYVVARMEQHYGFLIGSASGYQPLLHPSSYSATSGFNSALANNDTWPPTLAAECLVNGVRCNPMHTHAQKGLQLIELHAADNLPMQCFGTLFNDRNINGRYGGDFVGEVLVFNGVKSLSQKERMRISRYLMQKWGIVPATGEMTAKTAEDAVVASDSLDGMQVEGCGTWVKTGDGAAIFRPTAASPMTGVKVDVEAGSLTAQVHELSYSPKAGEQVIVTSDKYESHTVQATVDAVAAEKGEVTVTCALAESGRAGSLRLARIGADVKTLRVTGTNEVVLGEVVRDGTRLPAGACSATIANAGFESSFSSADWVWVVRNGSSGIKSLTTEGEVEDWRITGDGNDRVEFRNTYRHARFYAPEGSRALLLKQLNTLYGHVSVPVDGDYVFGFQGTGRYKYDNMQLFFSLVDANETTNTFASCNVPIGDGFRPYRFRVPNVKKGDYKLVIETKNGKASSSSSDSHAALDDFRMDLVTGGSSATGAVAVPNGAFERTYFTVNTRLVTDYGLANLACPGWKLTPGPQGGDVCVVSRLMSGYRYAQGCGDLGEWQLQFTGDAGRAKTAPFTLPAGRWKLQCRAAKWAFEGNKWNGKSGRNLNPSVGVTVSRNGTTAFDAKATASSFDLKTLQFGNVLEVATGDTIEIEVRQATANSSDGAGACLSVDDFEFVPADELVRNGSFTEGDTGYAGWTRAVFSTVKGGAYATTMGNRNDDALHYGLQQHDNPQMFCFINAGALAQQIAFPAAGTYRLSFWTRSRVSGYDGIPNTWEYGGNRMRAALIDANAVTNVIVETPSVFSTNFCETAALFTVPEAGTYTLWLESLNNPDTGVWTGGSRNDSYVFLDGVSVKAVSGAETLPSMAEDLSLVLDAETKVRLDFDGELTIKGLKIGRKGFYGHVDATHESGLFTGPGSLFMTSHEPATILIFR